MRIKSLDGDSSIITYIKAIFTKQGRNFTTCELCGKHPIKGEIHHTKYNGATPKDLKIACRSCQMQPQNIRLV